MLYYPDINIGYAHFPRTGGTSTRALLNSKFKPIKTTLPRANQHVPLNVEVGNLETKGIDFYKIRKVLVGMRNPFDMLVSLYCWWHNNITKDQTFDQFINFYEGKTKWEYKSFIFIDGEMPNNVEIIKFENLKEDLDNALNKKLNLGFNMENFPHKHRTRHAPFMEYYTDQKMIDRVIKKFKWVFDTGYYEIPKLNEG